MEKLKTHRLACAERLLALGERLSPQNHVLMNADGTAINPQSLTQWCRNEFGKLHGLRHSHASQLLNAGVNIKAVSARLGHGSAAMTLSVYAHCLPGADEDAAEKIDVLLSVANQ
jgi:integrase